MIGNSSSGLTEAPFLGLTTINIGNRQEGRPLAKSVLSCNDTIKEINKSIKQLDSVKKNRSISYKGRNMVDVVLKVLATTKLNNIKLKKFYDINQ